MAVPLDALFAIGASILGILSAIAHRSRCFLRHVGARYDWGIGYGKADSQVEPPDVAHAQNPCAPIDKIWGALKRVITLVRG